MENVKKVIEFYENDNYLMNSSIDKITVDLVNRANEGCQLLLLTGCSPCVGTTSISIALAISMAATGRRTVLVDCDVRKSVRYKKLNDNVSSGVADYLVAQDNTVIDLNTITYPTNIANLTYIPCGKCETNPTRILCSNRMNQLLAQLKGMYECVIFDFPSLSVVPDADILFGKVDGIITIAALGETRKKDIKYVKEKLNNYSNNYYGMIINKVHKDIFKANVKNSDYYIEDKNGIQKFENNKKYKKYKKYVKATKKEGNNNE